MKGYTKLFTSLLVMSCILSNTALMVFAEEPLVGDGTADGLYTIIEPTDAWMEEEISSGEDIYDRTNMIKQEQDEPDSQMDNNSDGILQDDVLPAVSSRQDEELESQEVSIVGTSSGQCGDNAFWSFEDGILTISGSGDMYDYYNFDEEDWPPATPWSSFADQIKTVIMDDNITRMGNCAFYYCINLETVKLPLNLKTIDYMSFTGCSSLKSIILPEGINHIETCAFQSCKSLTSVKFPKTLEVIGPQAFCDCTSLTKISIPVNVKDLTVDAFADCANLTMAVIYNDNISMIYPFYGCKKVTLFGNPGSNAEKHAKEQNIPFATLGSLPSKAPITGLKEMSIGKLRIQAANKGTQADGYQFKWALDSSFTTGVKSASSTKHYIFRSGLVGGKTYYVRARTFKTVNGVKYYSNWSGTKSIKLNILPPKPTLVALKKNGTGFTVTWKKTSGVSGFQIRYSTSSSFTSKKTASVTGAGKTSFTKKNLVEGQTYYVSVRSFNVAADGTKYYSKWSTARQITIR